MEELAKELREAADDIDRQIPIAREVIEAARDALEAMIVLQEKDDGGLISPARHRLARALKACDEL